MGNRMSNKQIVIEQIYQYCKNNQQFVFDNELVKQFCQKYQFDNAFDVTKIDHSTLLPQSLKNDNVFITHLGNGQHQFVNDISIGYHAFEPIEPLVLVSETKGSQ
jgi:hypothetical protein